MTPHRSSTEYPPNNRSRGLLLAICLLLLHSPVIGQNSFSQWENAHPNDPGFVPIGVWLQNPSRAEAYAEIGINLYIGLHQGPTEAQLKTLRDAGMRVIASQNTYARSLIDTNDPLLEIVVGWMQQDEPDNAQWNASTSQYDPPLTPEVIQDRYAGFSSYDPTRPVYLNLSQGVAWDGWIGRGTRTNRPEDYPEYQKGADILSFDIYPAASTRTDIKGNLWRVAYGTKRLREWTDADKPVWTFIECTDIHGGGKATPHQVRALVWMAFIHGATGIEYFAHEFSSTGSFITDHGVLRDTAMRDAVAAINAQVTDLAPVLNSPSIEKGHTVEMVTGVTDDPIRQEFGIEPVATMLKHQDGAAYLFAVRMRDNPADARFTIDGLEGVHEVEVMGETRTLAVDNGVFTDQFGAWDSRIYRIATADPSGRVYGYEMEDGVINTGDFLGYLYAEKAPWTYSYATGGWWYVPDPASDLTSAEGAWIYVLNL